MNADSAPADLAALWSRAAREFADRVAFRDETGRLTYAEADREVRRLAAALASLGVPKGDPVAFALSSSNLYGLLCWAAFRLGAVVAPVNVRLGPEEFLSLFSNLSPKVLFIHPEMRPRLEPALDERGHIQGVGTVVSTAAGLGGRRPWPPGSLVLDEVLSGAPEEPPAAEISPDDPAIVMHTSGTTGRPKGAVMRHRDVLFNLDVATRAHGLEPDDVHLLVLPIFHPTALYSLLPAAASRGASVAFVRRSEIPAALTCVERERATTLFGVPTLLQFLVASPGLPARDLSSLRLIAYAGSRMPDETVRELRARFPRARLHNFFGLTETTSMTHLLPDAEAAGRPGSIGRLLEGVSAAVLDEEGREMPAGETGELGFARENVVAEYWGEPGRIEESLAGEGQRWWRTGDLASVDSEGFYYLRGRKKEMIIVGGENVYAAEVEAALTAHPGVAEAAVIGLPASGMMSWMGEVVKAFVVPRKGREPGARELQAWCASRLASYKVPQKIELRDSLPKTASGKVMKRELEEGA